MKQVRIHDKIFQLYIPYAKIRASVKKMAQEMSHDFAGERPLFVCILNGSFMFAAELMKRIKRIETEISFVKLSSYAGVKTTGKVSQLIGLNENIEGRTVVILEDIVDSGLTIDSIRQQLLKMNPAKIAIATLLLKPDSLEKDVQLDYIGLKIPNDFIVGFGLDYNGLGRNLKDIYSVINE
ncbi:MAG: hypoxanthine phosphoribosyltransferase [Mariniphaga sp.]|nr:hypoxanthine phosphoribosyltransferase [Mariniphaga sp.]MDD4226535.1 hypoxanthine phosphoribosyltransferase [Mariniphaga sp.]MDD4425395.1 hypoxanthine phosphoribosyltransferase [Mariniphaga sp.]